MRAKQLPPQDVLNNLLSYDPEMGSLRWKERPIDFFSGKYPERDCLVWNKNFSGKIISSIGTPGYLRVTVFLKRYSAHRIIWKMIYGNDPDVIDHINGIKTDNRLVNLRSVTMSQNAINSESKETRYATGVYRDGRDDVWYAQITHEGVTHYLGRHESFDAALKTRKAAEMKFHGEYRRIDMEG
jgi:hypothetical protein